VKCVTEQRSELFVEGPPMSNDNHAADGKFSSVGESKADSIEHANKARDHAEKAHSEAKKALASNDHKEAKKHSDKAHEHHEHAEDHAHAAHEHAHSAGHQVHAHVAEEHAHDPNLLQMLAAAAEHVNGLVETGAGSLKKGGGE
jgi:nickel/cobalt transporter (NicO) family protein